MTSISSQTDLFGQRLTERRRASGLSQQELADVFGTSPSTIGKYERGKMKPSIEAAARLAQLLDTTVAYLLGEIDTASLYEDPKMVKRLEDIRALPDKEREALLLNVDHFIKASKIAAL